MALPEFPAPPTVVAAASGSPSSPSRTPRRGGLRTVTINQKQALMDNLQLEITERARRLRAQYMMQAQGLRTRIEIRVNRIPMSLRNATMGDLFAKYSAELEAASRVNVNDSKGGKMPPPAIAEKSSTVLRKENPGRTAAAPPAGPSRIRGTKRPSDEVDSAGDKENADEQELLNPKKRAKANTTTNAASRAASRSKIQPNQVLSPKSSNSRTIQRSPIRAAPSPEKSSQSRRVSPLKQISAATTTLAGMVEKAKTTRTGRAVASTASAAAKSKRGAPAPTTQASQRDRVTSNSSQASTATVVTKSKTTTTTATRQPAARARPAPVAAKAKKPAPPKVEAPATGRRVLRKRA
ncbi:MAG: hypothetical protein M4579_002547 [Chaenotheca gracillima]|nr:MAG: hypothetical protein M4579_002547 [Chaenotheca gracillima]